ncbi:MAG: PspC domain-containing protein [Gammaproteobacteria bacterium]|nr:PspC domain-containing protein [Gammaproteobacteria bacterium]MYF03114.1 PspC domain-containing protein [Gammaproteobacteria bacterium]MYI78220.1 PspC domain-containing protein [Gammaproteobacteria bacterium]
MRNRYMAGERTAEYMDEAFSRHSAWILGVCAGIANRMGFNPAILRVVTFVCLLFMPLKTIAVYLLVWVIFFRHRRG